MVLFKISIPWALEPAFARNLTFPVTAWVLMKTKALRGHEDEGQADDRIGDDPSS